MLCLTCTTITSVDLAHYGVSRAKDWVSVDCGTRENINMCICYIFVYITYLHIQNIQYDSITLYKGEI